MSASYHFRSAFVPHDLPAPIAGAAEGPLAGLTVAVKDMYDIAGTRTGGGSPDWLNTHLPAASHAAVIRRLLERGATVIGKTVCDEFFFSVTGANAHYGTPINPRAPGRLPGGSSSGSAAAAAAGACDFSLGSDTGGSVRVPAAFCGVYGIRPTHGRIDMTGAMPMAPSFDVPGWFASGPGVLRRVGEVLLDAGGVRAHLRELIILDDAFAEADAEVASLLRAAIDAMAGDLPEPVHDVVAPTASISGAKVSASFRRGRSGASTGRSSNGIGRSSVPASASEWSSRPPYRSATPRWRGRNRGERASGFAP